MKNILKIGLILSTIILTNIPKISLAKSAEQDVKETGIVRVGIRNDTPLFGFGDEHEGYCASLAQELAKKLSRDYGKNIKLEIVNSTTQNRWNLVTQGKVHLECGPNSITNEREKELNIVFSEPFFFTATQIFAQNGIEENTIRNASIGVIPNTTNESDLTQVYSQNKLNNSYLKRTHGIADVILGDLTGFASDGILLIGTATMMDVDLRQYTLVTPFKNERPFCAEYGMILPGGAENKPWRDRVNEVISANGIGSKTWNTWFEDSLLHLNAVLNACKH